jgi:hypothetical protein
VFHILDMVLAAATRYRGVNHDQHDRPAHREDPS